MNKSLLQVEEFHNTFDHPVGNLIDPEPLHIRQLRIKLLFEELAELAEASDCKLTMLVICGQYCEINTNEQIKDGNDVDKIEELDALCDIQYVLNGKILTGGYHYIFDREFDVVHSNNMTKAHSGARHVGETIRIKGDSPNDYTVVQKEDKWLLFNKDGKLTKPHDHTKVKLTLK